MKRPHRKMGKNTWQVKNVHGPMIIVFINTAAILIFIILLAGFSRIQA